MLTQKRVRPLGTWGALSIAALAAVALQVGGAEVLAKGGGGTARPPPIPPVPTPAGCAAGTTPCHPVNPPVAPAMGVSTTTSVGFLITGHIQNATCDSAAANSGGTVTINGMLIHIPTETIVQYPATTQTWRSAVCPPGASATVSTQPPVALDGTGGNVAVAVPPVFPSVEMTVIGNTLGGGVPNTGPVLLGTNGVYEASLVYASEEFVNAGQGYIDHIDYTDGSLYVQATGTGGLTRLLINDPTGRYGRKQTSTDARFGVDDANPTITAAASGYPMCVPRTDPAVTDDPACPQRNRPRVGVDLTAVSGLGCRNFADAGFAVAPGRRDLGPPAAGQAFCPAFVMKAIANMPGTGAPGFNAVWLSTLATDTDPRQQAPFENGDFITWIGTLAQGVQGATPTTPKATVWVHTIAANVGIFTQPRTLPGYIAVNQISIGVDPQVKAPAVAPPGIETTSRLVVSSVVTDISSNVDFYLHDYVLPTDDRLPANNGIAALAPDIVANSSYDRWLTPESMTGSLAGQTNAAKPLPSAGVATSQPFGGGITTQFDGPLIGRARIRAITAPAVVPGGVNCTPGPVGGPAGRTGCTITASPTRYVRAVIRQLCGPDTAAKVNTPADVTAIDTVEPNFTGINKSGVAVTALPGSSNTVVDPSVPVAASDGTCGQRAQFANGLFTGQYVAPVPNFIFAEQIQAGQPFLPDNLWQMDFLVHGEGGQGGNSNGPQVPQPW